MKKLVFAAFVIVSLTGYLLWPASVAPDAAPAVAFAPVPAPAAGAPVPAPSAARLEVVPLPAAAPTRLAIRYADGTPARGLWVWFWRDDALRPVWSRPVDASRDREIAPGAVNASGEPVPPPPHATTDEEGWVVCTADRDVVAVSVQYAQDQQYSAPFPVDGAAFVLPPLGDLEAGIRNAPTGTRWSALVGAIVIEEDGGRSGYSALRANVIAPSGPGVVRICEHRYELADAERLHAPMPRGWWAGVELDGHGFDLRLLPGPDGEAIEGHLVHVRAPAIVEAESIGRLGAVAVEVREPDGSPVAVGGHCHLAQRVGPATPSAEEQKKPLVHGAATFDETAWAEGTQLELTVLLADGEWFRREVEFAGANGGPRVVLTRGSGRAPLRIATGGDAIVRGVLLEQGDGSFASVQPGDGFFTATLPAYGVHGGVVRVSLVPEGWRSLWVVAADGAAGSIAATACLDGVGNLQWLPSHPLPAIDVAALFRDYGDHTMMSARLQLGFADGAGHITWFTVAGHRRFRRAEPAPPVWHGLCAPEGLRSRIELYAADEPDGSGGTTLELAVPR